MEMIGGITDSLLKKNSNTQVCEAEGDGREGDTAFLYLWMVFGSSTPLPHRAGQPAGPGSSGAVSRAHCGYCLVEVQHGETKADSWSFSI